MKLRRRERGTLNEHDIVILNGGLGSLQLRCYWINKGNPLGLLLLRVLLDPPYLSDLLGWPAPARWGLTTSMPLVGANAVLCPSPVAVVSRPDEDAVVTMVALVAPSFIVIIIPMWPEVVCAIMFTAPPPLHTLSLRVWHPVVPVEDQARLTISIDPPWLPQEGEVLLHLQMVA
jgi:hypothetical protein